MRAKTETRSELLRMGRGSAPLLRKNFRSHAYARYRYYVFTVMSNTGLLSTNLR